MIYSTPFEASNAGYNVQSAAQGMDQPSYLARINSMPLLDSFDSIVSNDHSLELDAPVASQSTAKPHLTLVRTLSLPELSSLEAQALVNPGSPTLDDLYEIPPPPPFRPQPAPFRPQPAPSRPTQPPQASRNPTPTSFRSQQSFGNTRSSNTPMNQPRRELGLAPTAPRQRMDLTRTTANRAQASRSQPQSAARSNAPMRAHNPRTDQSRRLSHVASASNKPAILQREIKNRTLRTERFRRERLTTTLRNVESAQGYLKGLQDKKANLDQAKASYSRAAPADKTRIRQEYKQAQQSYDSAYRASQASIESMRSKTKEQHLSELGLTTNDITPPNTAPFQIPRNLTEFFSVGARINDAMSTFMNQLQNLGLYSEKVVLEESVLQSAVAAHSTPNKPVVPVTEAAMSTQEGRATLSKQFGFDPAKVEQVVAKNIATAQQDSTKTPAPNKPLPTTSIRYKVNHNGVASELVLVHTTIGSGATRQVGKGTGKKLSREWLEQSLEKSSPEVRKQLEGFAAKLAEDPRYELYLESSRTPGVNFQSIISRIPGKVLGEFDAYSPGHLRDKYAVTFSGSRYASIELEQPIKLYRVYHPYPGYAEELGSYWSLEKPSGSLQAIIDSALLPEFKNQAVKWVEIEAPAGTRINIGEVASQNDHWIGGGSQILFDDWVQESWIKERGDFK